MALLTGARARPARVVGSALVYGAVVAALAPGPAQATGRANAGHLALPVPVSALPAVRIQVGARLGRPVSRYVFGANLLWAYNAEGAFNPRTGRFDPGFVRALRRLGVTALRYPGGTTSDSFFWQRAVGPRRDRPPNEPYGMQAARRSPICCVLDGPAASNVGPDEFGRLLGQLGAAGTVTVNFATGTAQQAADFVAYMTARAPLHPVRNPALPGYWAQLRARNGHRAPYRVPYWEVGNEQVFPGQFGWRSGQLVSLGAGGAGCPLAQIPTCLYIYGGTTAFFHQRVGRPADQLPYASLSNGAPHQVFDVYFPPVVPGSLRVYVGGQRWEQTSDLSLAGPAARVFSLDASSGALRFGDGYHGAVPPAGALVTVDYRSGPHQGFLGFYSAMKRMNPRVKVCESEETDLAFLAIMGRRHRYDCVQLHLYARPTATRAPLAVYEHQLMSSVPRERAALASLQSAVRRYAGRPVPVLVTEYGQLVAPVPASDPQFNLSLEEGLFSAAQIFTWAQTGVPVAEKYLTVSAPFPLTRFSTMADTDQAMVASGLSVYSAMVVHSGPRFVAEPTGQVLGLLRALGGARLLPLSWGSRHPPPSVVALAALAPGRHLLVAVVNARAGASVAAQVQGPLGQGCMLRASVLDGATPTSYNTPDRPALVTVRTSTTTVRCGSFHWVFPAHSLSLLQLSAVPAPLLAAGPVHGQPS